MSPDTASPAAPAAIGLDDMIDALERGIDRWAQSSPTDRAALLRATRDSVSASAQDWVDAALAAKAAPTHASGEEWLSGPAVTAMVLDLYAASCDHVAAGRSPIADLPIRRVDDDRVAVRILPGDLMDQVLFSGFHAEVWLQPGVDEATARADAGLGAARPGENGGVGAVLGAGNISGIGPTDVAYELVAFNRASVLKLNPTFAGLAPAYRRAFAPLIDADLVRIVVGGADVGAELVEHDRIAHIHITGSAATHDAIVWGTGDEAASRRDQGTPRLTTPISSELGGVSPIIVVPGEWSDADLRFQAEHVVTQRLHNAGHNCIAGQSLVLSSDWDLKDRFLDEIRAVLGQIGSRRPWYPGAGDRLRQAETTYPDAEWVGDVLLVPMEDQAPTELYDGEYFAAVLGVTQLPGTGGEFLDAAVRFANERLDGTLGASIIAHPDDIAAMGALFETCVDRLNYGTVAVNAWSALGFLLPGAAWGAAPGNTLEHIGSGRGVVHNGYLLAHVQKTVGRGPFRPFPRSILNGELSLSPRPMWFVTARTAPAVGRHLARLAGRRTWSNVLRVLPSALRG